MHPSESTISSPDAPVEIREPTRPSANRWLYPVLLALITAAYSLWVLSLPLFPTQDGPMHLYYTHVLHALLFGGGGAGIYSRFYAVRHILPPYALYYYTLMLLSRAVPLVMADKLVTCLYFLCFAFGFRYLANSVGHRGNLMALLATPLLLNWSLGMGFLNFCLSAAIVLWALGLWCHAAGTTDHRKKIAFVLLTYIVMLTHPVPLLALITFCIVELAIRFFRHRRARATLLPPHMVSDLLYLFPAMGTLLYIKLFTSSLVTQQSSTGPHLTYLQSVLQNTKIYLLQRTQSFFGGHGPVDIICRLIFVLLLLAPLALAIHQRVLNRRLRRWTLGDTWLAISIALIFLLPFLPNEVNNAHYFAARLLIFTWLAALASASASTWRPAWKPLSKPGRFELAIIAAVLLSNLLVLATAESRLRPIARDIARLEAAPPPFTQRVGVLLDAPAYVRPGSLSFDPYYWAGATFFRRSGSVLFNSPWLVFSVMPLEATVLMPTSRLSASAMEQPDILGNLLLTSPRARQIVLPNIDFALLDSAAASPVPPVDAHRLPVSNGINIWTCDPHPLWFTICQKSSSQASPEIQPK